MCQCGPSRGGIDSPTGIAQVAREKSLEAVQTPLHASGAESRVGTGRPVKIGITSAPLSIPSAVLDPRAPFQLELYDVRDSLSYVECMEGLKQTINFHKTHEMEMPGAAKCLLVPHTARPWDLSRFRLLQCQDTGCLTQNTSAFQKITVEARSLFLHRALMYLSFFRPICRMHSGPW